MHILIIIYNCIIFYAGLDNYSTGQPLLCQTGLRFQYGPTFGSVKTTVLKAQCSPEIHVSRKNLQFGLVIALFIRLTITELKKYNWNGFFQSFLMTREIFIFEVCGKHSAG